MKLTEQIYWFENFEPAPAIAKHPDPERWTATVAAADADRSDGLSSPNSGGMIEEGEATWRIGSRQSWVAECGTQDRQKFTRAAGAIAVIDTAMGARIAAAGDGPAVHTLTSPAIPVMAGHTYELVFDSHYRRAGQSPGTAATAPAAVIATFDTGTCTTVVTLEQTQLSSRECARVIVPNAASTLHLSWQFRGAAGDYWAIDHISLREPLLPLPGETTPTAVVDIISDIQGAAANERMSTMIDALNGFDEPAHALVLNGDLVDHGAVDTYQEFLAALTTPGHRSGTVLPVIGNHEYYYSGRTAEQYRKLYTTSLAACAETGDLYYERIISGLPIVIIGSESYSYNDHGGAGPEFMQMSDAQFEWLHSRLKYWADQLRPVLLFSHHVLAYSVSGTHADFYRRDYVQQERLEQLLGHYPNIVMFTGHTHFDVATHADWAVHFYPDGGDARGVPIVNTGSVTTAFGPVGDYGEEALSYLGSTALRVKQYADRLVIEAWQFDGDGEASQVRELALPVPRGVRPAAG